MMSRETLYIKGNPSVTEEDVEFVRERDKRQGREGKYARVIVRARNDVGYVFWPERMTQKKEEEGKYAPRVDERVAKMLIEVDEMGHWEPAKSLIDRWFDQEALIALFGPSEVGKSLLSLEIALCMSAGIAWRGRRTECAQVVYCVGEGKGGIRRRIEGWKKVNNCDRTNMLLVDGCLALNELENLAKLSDAILVRRDTSRPLVVFVDTLARYFHADENSTEAMNTFVAGLQYFLQERLGAAVILVHHSGHLEGRMRGSSVLRAAVDTEIQLEPVRNGGSGRFRCFISKQKDGLRVKPIEMRPIDVELDKVDQYGRPVYGVALEMLVDEYAGEEVPENVSSFEDYSAVVRSCAEELGAQQLAQTTADCVTVLKVDVEEAFYSAVGAPAELVEKGAKRGKRVKADDVWRKRFARAIDRAEMPAENLEGFEFRRPKSNFL